MGRLEKLCDQDSVLVLVRATHLTIFFGIVVSSLIYCKDYCLTNLFSVYMLYWGVSSLVLTRISGNTKPKVHYLLSFVYNAKFRILETLMGLTVS